MAPDRPPATRGGFVSGQLSRSWRTTPERGSGRPRGPPQAPRRGQAASGGPPRRAPGSELRWIGGALGAVRDLDVLIEHYGKEAESLEPDERLAFRPILLRLARRRAAARRELSEALDSERYFELLDALEAVPARSRPCRDGARRGEAPVPEAPQAGAAQPGGLPEDTTLHELRKRAKHVRYAAERALGRRRPVAHRARLSRAKALQDVLGIHQDAGVGRDDAAGARRRGDPPGTGTRDRPPVERERARKADARAQWWEAWRRLKRAG